MVIVASAMPLQGNMWIKIYLLTAGDSSQKEGRKEPLSVRRCEWAPAFIVVFSGVRVLSCLKRNHLEGRRSAIRDVASNNLRAFPEKW